MSAITSIGGDIMSDSIKQAISPLQAIPNTLDLINQALLPIDSLSKAFEQQDLINQCTVLNCDSMVKTLPCYKVIYSK